MPEAILLPGADGTVGEEHERALTREPRHGLIGIDPRVHAFGGRELRAGRPKLGGEHGWSRSEGAEKVHDPPYYTCPPISRFRTSDPPGGPMTFQARVVMDLLWIL